MTDHLPEYDEIIYEVESRGFLTKIRHSEEIGHSLICATCRNAKGALNGTSFWIVTRKGIWYLASWGYRYWMSPEADMIPAICIEWLTRGTIAMPPPDVIQTYQLIELSDDDFDMVFVETHVPFVLKAIRAAQDVYFKTSGSYAHALTELEQHVDPVGSSDSHPWTYLPKGYTVQLQGDPSGWRAVVSHPDHHQLFEIDARGNMQVFDRRRKDES